MNNLSNIPGLDQMNSIISFCSEKAKENLAPERQQAFSEGMDLVKSGASLIVKAYNISEEQKTPKHILISIFTFGIFAIIKAIQLACVKNSGIQKLKLGVKKIEDALLTGTPYVGLIAKLTNPMIAHLKNIL